MKKLLLPLLAISIVACSPAPEKNQSDSNKRTEELIEHAKQQFKGDVTLTDNYIQASAHKGTDDTLYKLLGKDVNMTKSASIGVFHCMECNDSINHPYLVVTTNYLTVDALNNNKKHRIVVEVPILIDGVEPYNYFHYPYFKIREMDDKKFDK